MEALYIIFKKKSVAPDGRSQGSLQKEQESGDAFTMPRKMVHRIVEARLVLPFLKTQLKNNTRHETST